MQSRIWASHLFPWQSLAFSLLPVTDSGPGITASYNSTNGRGRFSFYQRGKIFQKHTTLKKQQNKHTTLAHLSLVSLNCVRPCASTSFNQSLAKMVMMVKTNSDLEGPIVLECIGARHLSKIRVLFSTTKGDMALGQATNNVCSKS